MTSQRVRFDSGPPSDAIGTAILRAAAPQHVREALTWARVEDEAWWGSRTDPPGDPLRLGRDTAGTFAMIAGQRVPVTVDERDVHLGIPERIGRCTLWAIEAADRLLRTPGVSGISIVFGRCWGTAQQTFTEYEDGEGWHVLDLTLSDTAFDRDAYLRALHAVVGLKAAIPDAATLAELREEIEASAVDGIGYANDLLSRLMPLDAAKES
jgi:hypothetical protein